MTHGRSLSISRLMFSIGMLGLAASAAWADPATPAASPTAAPDATTPIKTEDVGSEVPKWIDASPNWAVVITPGIAWMGASGKAELKGSGAGTNTDSLVFKDAGLEDAEISPYARLTWRPTGADGGRWSVGISGFGVSSSSDSVAVEAQRIGDVTTSIGDNQHAKYSFWNVDIEGGYRFFQRSRAGSGRQATRVAFTTDALFGIRMMDTEVKFENRFTPTTLPPPGTIREAKGDGFFIQPMVGLRIGAEFVEQFGVELKTTVGAFPGDHRSFSWDIEPMFTWRPNPNLGVFIGYRMFAFDVRDGKGVERYQWKGAMAGLNIGAYVRF
ncbi:MAG: hypothetical protein KGS45_04785 [Planctomycetes bacterium]|nr:hypothetical protein [Planctomycetota bacterium]